MKPIISVSNLSKQYRIGVRSKHGSLRETISEAFRAPLKQLRRNGKSVDDLIWALKDVSFEVTPGEVLGIIGRNGAGKSTLLKILSRITDPTGGRVEIYGRVGSLLEVGTGFHPELTGRENIYLNGSILGMSRKEIELKFDEIVAFAEIARFIDTPVKRYSSGMYVRLAFAVAAHLEPEILIVDEVLAVGDAAFQKKCLNKMGNVAEEGRTVLFVSHNMGAMKALCDRAILLDQGEMKLEGDTEELINVYINKIAYAGDSLSIADRTDRKGDGRIRFVSLALEDSNGDRIPVLRSGMDANFVFGYECHDGLDKEDVVVSFAIKDSWGAFLLHHRTSFSKQNFQSIPSKGHFTCRIPKLPLAPGEYSVNIFVGINEEPCDLMEDAQGLTVEIGDFFGTGSQGMPGFCRILVEGDWRLRG